MRRSNRITRRQRRARAALLNNTAWTLLILALFICANAIGYTVAYL